MSIIWLATEIQEAQSDAQLSLTILSQLIKNSELWRGHRYYLDTLLVRKISKRHFLKDIENSFQEVTQIGPEPRHFFSFSNISTNRVARDFQNFGRNGP